MEAAVEAALINFIKSYIATNYGGFVEAMADPEIGQAVRAGVGHLGQLGYKITLIDQG